MVRRLKAHTTKQSAQLPTTRTAQPIFAWANVTFKQATVLKAVVASGTFLPSLFRERARVPSISELVNMHSNDSLASWEIVEQIQRICPTGKSLLIFRNRVKPRNQKYFASLPTQISSLNRTVSFRQEGRIARRHETRGGMRWTRRCQASNSEPDE